jgi:hypothetical protein
MDRKDALFDEDLPDVLKAQREVLLLVPSAPAVWALHFVLCYATAAVWCAKVAGRDGSLDTARLLIGGYTVAALAAIALIGRLGWTRHGYGDETAPHEDDTPADRHRFLGFATFLLAALSFVATIFVALSAVFVETCR